MVAAWLRSGRLVDQNNSSSSPHLPLPSRGPWTGERGETSRTFLEPLPNVPAAVFPTILPRVSLATEPHLREPLASDASRLFGVVSSFTQTFSRHRTFPLSWVPFVARATYFLVLFWFKVSRANSDDSAGFQWLKSRDISVNAQTNCG